MGWAWNKNSYDWYLNWSSMVDLRFFQDCSGLADHWWRIFDSSRQSMIDLHQMLLAYLFFIIFFQMTDSWHKVYISPINTSKSKLTYSFSKTKRFEQSTHNKSCQKFYDLPPILGNAPKPTMGFGNKTQLAPKDTKQMPSPTHYHIKSIFEQTKKGFGFGVGRQNMKPGNIFNKTDNPGPGAYTIPEHTDAPEITLKPRLKQPLPSSRHNPGPGSYELPKFINEQGKYCLSTLRNSLVPSFKQHKSIASNRVPRHTDIPGPGTYELKQNISPTGTYFNSKFHNSMTKSFGKLERKVFQIKDITLGPGSYHIQSEFGS